MSPGLDSVSYSNVGECLASRRFEQLVYVWKGLLSIIFRQIFSAAEDSGRRSGLASEGDILVSCATNVFFLRVEGNIEVSVILNSTVDFYRRHGIGYLRVGCLL